LWLYQIQDFQKGTTDFPTGKKFLCWLNEHPGLIPGLRNPQGVFFMLSEYNFSKEWFDYILPAFVDLEGEKVSIQTL
jgi:hypothetical protein